MRIKGQNLFDSTLCGEEWMKVLRQHSFLGPKEFARGRFIQKDFMKVRIQQQWPDRGSPVPWLLPYLRHPCEIEL